MTIDDDTLMAYVDGELEPEQWLALEQALGQDPALAGRVAALRALNTRLSAAMAGELAKPVPERLLNAVRTAPAGAARLVDLGARHITRSTGPWPRWGAIAASVALGALAGIVGLRVSNDSVLELVHGRLAARGELARALERQPSGMATAGARVQVNLSFKDSNGHYCRIFGMRGSDAFGGLACRDGSGWAVDTLAPLPATTVRGSELRAAASEIPQRILQSLDTRIAGEALDRNSEQAALANGWSQ